MLRVVDQPADGDPSAEVSELDRLERAALDVLEPVVAGQKIEAAIAVNIRGCDPLGIKPVLGLSPFRRRRTEVGHVLDFPRFWRDVGDQHLLGLLIPKCELRPAGPLEIAEDLIVMLMRAAAA